MFNFLIKTAYAQTSSLIPLPTNFVASTTQTAATVLSDLSPYITLILGALLTVVIIEVLIGAIRGGKS